MYNRFMAQLTKQQIERQDFVDNQIFELMQKLIPPSKQIDWDIEAIGVIRETIRVEFIEKTGVMDEKSFYPYIKT